ncbi:MAG: hypothetical protein KGJ13_05745 [Patescibacteria group bacterium]|nr:hypothetical protein [Patescibacteria group bacterium]
MKLLLCLLLSVPVFGQQLPLTQVSDYPPAAYRGTCPNAQGMDTIGTYILCADDTWTTWTGFVYWSTMGLTPDSIGIYLRADDSTFIAINTEGINAGEQVYASELRGPLKWGEYVIPWRHNSSFVELQILPVNRMGPLRSNTLDKKVYYGNCYAITTKDGVRLPVVSKAKSYRYYNEIGIPVDSDSFYARFREAK